MNFCAQQNRVDLSNGVSDIIESFALFVLKDFRRRFEPYMPYYKAMELIDPTSTVPRITVEVRAAVNDICGVHGIGNVLPALTRMRRRINSGRVSLHSLNTAKKNILVWYNTRTGLQELLSSKPDRKLIRKFALSVLSINVVTAVTESTVSGHKNQKSKFRECLTDEAASISLQCRQYPDVVGTTGSSTTKPLQIPCIDMDACFDYDYSCHHRVNEDTDEENSDVSSDNGFSSSDD